MTSRTAATLSDEVRAFLDAHPHGTIATTGEDGAPHQALVWFLRRGDTIVVNSARGRRWPTELIRDGRCSFAVVDGPSWVSLTGVAEEVADAAVGQADIAEMARRYDPTGGDASIAVFRTQDRVSFVLHPARVHAEI